MCVHVNFFSRFKQTIHFRPSVSRSEPNLRGAARSSGRSVESSDPRSFWFLTLWEAQWSFRRCHTRRITYWWKQNGRRPVVSRLESRFFALGSLLSINFLSQRVKTIARPSQYRVCSSTLFRWNFVARCRSTRRFRVERIDKEGWEKKERKERETNNETIPCTEKIVNVFSRERGSFAWFVSKSKVGNLLEYRKGGWRGGKKRDREGTE